MHSTREIIVPRLQPNLPNLKKSLVVTIVLQKTQGVPSYVDTHHAIHCPVRVARINRSHPGAGWGKRKKKRFFFLFPQGAGPVGGGLRTLTQ